MAVEGTLHKPDIDVSVCDCHRGKVHKESQFLCDERRDEMRWRERERKNLIQFDSNELLCSECNARDENYFFIIQND